MKTTPLFMKKPLGLRSLQPANDNIPEDERLVLEHAQELQLITAWMTAQKQAMAMYMAMRHKSLPYDKERHTH